MFYIYVLKSIYFAKSYVGQTDNIERRLIEHNIGKSLYTNKYKPWKLIYTEEYKTRVEALRREKYLKSRSGRRELKKIFVRLTSLTETG
jgi:putative endonuclease